MKCDNYFCVYWEKEVCILSEITLNIQGRCEECIYVDIDEVVLRDRREDMLEAFEEREKWLQKMNIRDE